MTANPTVRWLGACVLGLAIATVIVYYLASWTNAKFANTPQSVCVCMVEIVECGPYEISGSIRDVNSNPIPNAEILIVDGDRSLRSFASEDGTFTLIREEGYCDDGPNSAAMLVEANEYQPGVFVVNFNRKEANVVLEEKRF